MNSKSKVPYVNRTIRVPAAIAKTIIANKFRKRSWEPGILMTVASDFADSMQNKRDKP